VVCANAFKLKKSAKTNGKIDVKLVSCLISVGCVITKVLDLVKILNTRDKKSNK